MVPEKLRVAVCVATYRRPEGLKQLIDALQGQEVHGRPALSLDLIVVDNDPGGSARDVVAQLARSGPWSITYLSEPRVGIPFARNAAVRCALAREAPLLAFVNDDDVPESRWIRTLVDALLLHRADVATGPLVVDDFDPAVPDWVRRGGFFGSVRYATGTLRDRAFNNNVLVRAEVFARAGRLFDERFRLQGEDTEFFLRATRSGCRIVWVDEAIVRTCIPESRARIGWLTRRAYRRGLAWRRIPLARTGHRRVALAGLVRGTLWLPWSWLGGRAAAVRALRLVATGVGYLAASVGARRGGLEPGEY